MLSRMPSALDRFIQADGSIALNAEDSTVGGDIEFVGAAIGAALEFEEVGSAALLEVGLLKDKAGDLGFGGGKDIRRDFVFRNVVVGIVAIIRVARRDGAGLGGTGGEERRRDCGKQEGGGFFHLDGNK